MRVVMLVGRSTGGIGTHVVDLTASLRSLGDEVHVVTDPLTADRFGVPDARPWWPDPRHPWRACADAGRMRRALRGADVVHAHGHQAGLVAVLVSRGLRPRPTVVVSLHNAVLHGTGPRGVALTAVERLVARNADLVTGASTDLVHRARQLGARRSELAPVPSPRVPALLAMDPPDDAERARLEASVLESAGLHRGGALVVTVSRVAPQKDLTTLLDAADELVTPVTWCVIGDGDRDLAERLEREIDERRLPVHLVGPVTDPGPWLRAAAVLVLTSRWEARALVVQEALAAGTPVVATDTGGLRDLLDGVGRLVPVGAAADVAEAVDDLLADPSSHAAARLAGRERARSWDDAEATARRWRRWYAAVGR
jgi:glycosyltransferase involved in cell wall biosynthesis